MFTVKWISARGVHSLYETDRQVVYWPFDQKTEEKAKVTFEIKEGACTLDSGEVYVMNSHGATVSKFILSSQLYPTGLEPSAAAA